MRSMPSGVCLKDMRSGVCLKDMLLRVMRSMPSGVCLKGHMLDGTCLMACM